MGKGTKVREVAIGDASTGDLREPGQAPIKVKFRE